MHNILLCPKERDDDHKVMIMNDAFKDDENDSHDDYTEDEISYEGNGTENVFLIKKERQEKESKKKQGGTNDKEKVIETPATIEQDSKGKLKQEKEMKEDARKIEEVTKFFEELAQSYVQGKKSFQTCKGENANVVMPRMYVERVAFLQCGIQKRYSEYKEEYISSEEETV